MSTAQLIPGSTPDQNGAGYDARHGMARFRRPEPGVRRLPATGRLANFGDPATSTGRPGRPPSPGSHHRRTRPPRLLRPLPVRDWRDGYPHITLSVARCPALSRHGCAVPAGMDLGAGLVPPTRCHDIRQDLRAQVEHLRGFDHDEMRSRAGRLRSGIPSDAASLFDRSRGVAWPAQCARCRRNTPATMNPATR